MFGKKEETKDKRLKKVQGENYSRNKKNEEIIINEDNKAKDNDMFKNISYFQNSNISKNIFEDIKNEPLYFDNLYNFKNSNIFIVDDYYSKYL